MSVMGIDLGLIKEVRETTDWLLSFPEKLVSAVLKPQEEFLKRRERIRKLKEIVELREIAKTIQGLYISKGSIVVWIESLQSEHSVEDAKYVRELFEEVRSGIASLKETVGETTLTNTALGTEAAIFLSRSEAAYKQLAELPEEALVHDKAVVEIARLLERMMESAHALVKQLDEHRKMLDHYYSD